MLQTYGCKSGIGRSNITSPPSGEAAHAFALPDSAPALCVDRAHCEVVPLPVWRRSQSRVLCSRVLSAAQHRPWCGTLHLVCVKNLAHRQTIIELYKVVNQYAQWPA